MSSNLACGRAIHRRAGKGLGPLVRSGICAQQPASPDHVTPLMCATCSASCETAVLLLEHGADIGMKNVHESTALQIAIAHGADSEIIALLLWSGASA